MPTVRIRVKGPQDAEALAAGIGRDLPGARIVQVTSFPPGQRAENVLLVTWGGRETGIGEPPGRRW